MNGLGSPGRAALASALPDFGLAAVYVLAWTAPNHIAPWVPRWAVLTMLLEFVVVHSTGFMGVIAFGRDQVREQVGMLLLLSAVYSLLVAGFAAGFHEWWMFGSFWLLTANRLSGILAHRDPGNGRGIDAFVIGWAASTLFYLLGAVLTAALDVPRFGLADPAVIRGMHLEGGGLWVDEPWRVLAFGAAYFTAVGLFELAAFAIVHRKVRARRDARGAGGLPGPPR